MNLLFMGIASVVGLILICIQLYLMWVVGDLIQLDGWTSTLLPSYTASLLKNTVYLTVVAIIINIASALED